MQQTLTLLAGEMAVVSPEVAYLYRPAVPRVAGCLHEVCITTLAVLAFFWCSINNLRFQRLVDLYCSYLVEAAGRASAVNRDPINLNVLQFTLRIQYSNVSGWAVAMAGMHSQIAESFKNIGVSKVQLFSSFIYGINYKPFGTGHESIYLSIYRTSLSLESALLRTVNMSAEVEALTFALLHFATHCHCCTTALWRWSSTPVFFQPPSLLYSNESRHKAQESRVKTQDACG